MKNERLMKIILSPVISEKSTMSAEMANEYVFKVVMDASKPEIKRAVEFMFKVKVDDVRTLRVKGKQKRRGMRIGRQASWKKAMVKLAAGDSIAELVGAE